jgi:hypothetical protein
MKKVRKKKKSIDSKQRRFRVDNMERNPPEQPNGSPLVEADFGQKLELIRIRYGSLAKFIKAQQSRSQRESNECSIAKRRPTPVTT